MSNVREIIINSPKYGQKIVLIDEEDWDLVSKYNWCLSKSKHTFYAISNGKLMHRIILGELDKQMIDHKDRDGLNNQRSNLRRCNYQQNSANMRLLISTNTTGFRGVKHIKSTGRYESYIHENNKYKSLGTYPNAVDAAHAYNKAAIKIYKSFATLNPL